MLICGSGNLDLNPWTLLEPTFNVETRRLFITSVPQNVGWNDHQWMKIYRDRRRTELWQMQIYVQRARYRSADVQQFMASLKVVHCSILEMHGCTV